MTVLPLGGDDDRDALDAWLMDPSVDKRIHDAKGPDLAVLSRTGGDAVIRGVSWIRRWRPTWTAQGLAPTGWRT